MKYIVIVIVLLTTPVWGGNIIELRQSSPVTEAEANVDGEDINQSSVDAGLVDVDTLRSQSEVQIYRSDADTLGLYNMRPIYIATTDTTLLSSWSGAVISTSGAAGPIEVYLPSASQGLEYWFSDCSGDSVTVNAAAGDSIFCADFAAPQTGEAQIASNDMKSQIGLRAMSNDVWIVFDLVGTWDHP